MRIGRTLGFRNLHAGNLSQITDRVDIPLPAVLHQKSDGAAMRAATEAVKKLLRRTHGERWRFFGVKWTQPSIVLPALFQLNVAADDFDDVDAREQVLNEALGNHFPESVRIAGSLGSFTLTGRPQPAIESAAKAVEAAVLGKHRDLEMVARARHGVALRTAFDFSGSIRELVHAIEIARRRGVADQEAKLLNSLGNTYNDAGLQYEALALFERAATFFESSGDHLSAWMALDNAALAAMRLE